MYSRPLKVYQGVNNPIQVIVKNQDQKKVNLTGYAIQADIQDPVNKVTVNSYAVTFFDAVAGQGTLMLDKVTLNSLEQRFYKLTFKTIKLDTNEEGPLYVDDNYQAPIDLEILPAYYSVVEPSPAVDNSVVDGGEITL